MKQIFWLTLPFLIFLSGCTISLSGVSVPTDVKTFSVTYIENDALIQVPTLSQDITDRLLQKCLNETQLVLNNEKPDIEFSGVITSYKVTSEAPQPGQNTSLNRLDINVKIEFTDHVNDERSWSSSFSEFANFDPNTNIDEVQDDLIDQILKIVVDNIYQKAFTNW